GTREDRRVRHPLGVRVGVPVEPHRGDDAAARARVRGNPDRRALSARGKLPHLAGIRCSLPPRLARACRRHGGRGCMSVESPPPPDPRDGGRRDTMLRIALPVVVLALVLLVWELAVRLTNTPAYQVPGPGLVFSTLISDWPILAASLLATLTTTFAALGLAVLGGIALAILFSQSRLIEYSLYPY